jgi:hypothetical protein
MPADSLEGMCTQLVIQNAPMFGRALAELMLASLTGRDVAAASVLQRSKVSAVEERDSAALATLPANLRKSKRPGSAKANNEQILTAIAKEGSSLQQIVEKTQMPKKYVRSRLNRLIRDDGLVRTQGKTTKTRYFRV